MVGEVGLQSPSPRQPFTLAAMSTVTSRIPVSALWEKFDYKPLTGELVRKNRNKPVKGWEKPRSWLAEISVDGKRIQTAYGRLIYAWCAGVWPEPTVDHIDRNPRNNKFWNLRPATPREQCFNRKNPVKGISWSVKDQAWVAYIYYKDRNVFLGQRKDPFDAELLYLAALELLKD